MRVRLDRCPHGTASVSGRHRGDPHCQVPPEGLAVSLEWFGVIAGALARMLDRLDGGESEPPDFRDPEAVAAWITEAFARVGAARASTADPFVIVRADRCHKMVARVGRVLGVATPDRFGGGVA